MSNNRVMIYGLVDPRTGKVFYVGSTYKFSQRIYNHMMGRRGNPGIISVVKDLSAHGERFKVRIFETVSSNIRNKRERFWIVKCYEDGEPLVNRMVLYHRNRLSKRLSSTGF